MKEKSTIELTKQEAAALLGLLNKAVQAVGISDSGITAQNAVHFQKKLNEAFTEEPKLEEK